MTDLDRRCLSQERDLERSIARIESILARFPQSSHCATLQETRNTLVLDLHDMRRAHDAFDRRFAEACDDPTGQDLDSFDMGE